MKFSANPVPVATTTFAALRTSHAVVWVSSVPTSVKPATEYDTGCPGTATVGPPIALVITGVRVRRRKPEKGCE